MVPVAATNLIGANESVTHGSPNHPCPPPRVSEALGVCVFFSLSGYVNIFD